MTPTSPRRVRRRTARRPGVATMTVLGLLGIAAVGGGIGMLVFPPRRTSRPADLLEGLPVDGVVVPALVVVLGIGSLVALSGMWRRRRDLAVSARPRRRPDGVAQVLVAHGSRRGATAGLADMLALSLRSRGFDVDVLPAARVRDVTLYDAVVVGGSLHRGRWHRDARRCVRRNDEALRDRLVWLFSSGPLDDSAVRGDVDPVRQVRRAMDRIGARGHMRFGGALFEGSSGFVASRMAQPLAGDGRDPDPVDRWASHVADAIAWEHGGRRLAMSGQAL